MKQTVRLSILAAVLMGGVSCNKEASISNPEPAQRAVSEGKAWQNFQQKIAAGEANDPLRQYVSKGTRLVFEGSGPRPSRPKYNSFEREAIVDHEGTVVNPQPGFLIPCGGDNGEPDNPGTCVGGGGAPPVFVSSENQGAYSAIDNPNGYIYDLKIVSNS
ncbi:hypothetical protein [Hymenobacter rubripertinctus]|uniref:hypothetical protein n=1 Tax=Hymenobacter rubripertinctus TaxID=2029981 RepID=UPI0011C3796E|nr:hypothetical protein [Hymenobacter rubripertinctus]